jgi:hypothetical protein
MSHRITRCLGIALAIAALALPIQAQNVLSVRVESLEDLLADIDTIAVALGQDEGTSEGLLAMAQGVLGLPALDWIDRKSPLVIALPLEGMMLGDQGFVAAFPVSDTNAAIEAIKASVEGVEIDEDGMIHMPMGSGKEIVLLPSKGYMISGRNPSLVGGFDPTDLLAGAHLPPGTIAVEFNVDSMRAMIGMGLQGARQQIGSVLARTAEEGGQALDAESAAEVSNLVVGWIQSLVANTRSIQLALEVSGTHLVVHNHYLPVSGSALQSFLGAQEGGMPDLARLVDGKDASMVMVANMTWTDEATAAMNSFMEDYSKLLQSSLMDHAEGNPVIEMMPALMEQYAALMRCQRGDMAQVVDMSDGMRFVQVSGLKAGDDCSSIDRMTGEIVAALPEEAQEIFSFSSNAWMHNGVPVSSFAMDFAGLLETQMAQLKEAGDEDQDEVLDDVNAMMKGLFGEDGFEMYMAGVDDLWLGTGGAGGDASMKAMIDRATKGKRGQGIDPAVFAPFTVGAGAYWMMDFGKIFAGVGDLMPADKAGEIAEVVQLFDALGAMTGALEFQSDALALKFAMPTAGLATIAEMAQAEATGGHGEHSEDAEHGKAHEGHNVQEMGRDDDAGR